jgi:site-specific DNA-methyltransferase (cytosine-N4-specific)
MTKMEVLDLKESVAKQNYATHGLFRFYGKLPPLVVRTLLREAQEPIVDIMCGSGTVLLEATIARKSSIGFDINPLSTLVSKVKTTPLSSKLLKHEAERLKGQAIPEIAERMHEFQLVPDLERILSATDYKIPRTNMVERWFTNSAKLQLAILKYKIDNIGDERLRSFFLVAFAAILRRASTASPRAGKLFRSPDESERIVPDLFFDKLSHMIDSMVEFEKLAGGKPEAEVILTDSRNLPVKDEGVPFVFWHPPYFALYRYSAIYSLELDWLGFERTLVRRGEIEEGYKTSEVSRFEDYIADLTSVLSEVRRILARDGECCVVLADSSLRDSILPATKRFRAQAQRMGFKVSRMVRRPIHFAQASYHPSSKSHLKRKEDIAFFLRKKAG